MHGWGWIQHATSTRVCCLRLAVTTWIIAIWPFLSSWSGSFILWFNIGFEIPRPTLTSTLLQLVARAQHGLCGRRWCLRWRIQLCCPPLGNRFCACAQSGDLALEGCISSLTGSLPLGHEGRGQASPVVHSWQPRSKARGPGELWCGWEAVLKLRARTKDAGPTLNVLQLPTPKVN